MHLVELLELFVCDEKYDIPWSHSHPCWHKTFVKRQKSFITHRLYATVNTSFVQPHCGRLIRCRWITLRSPLIHQTRLKVFNSNLVLPVSYSLFPRTEFSLLLKANILNYDSCGISIQK